MKTSYERPDAMKNLARSAIATTLAIQCIAILFAQGCAQDQAAQQKVSGEPRAFASPDEAVHGLTAALRAEDMGQLRAIVGDDGEQIVSSGDEVADRQRRQKFLTLYDQKHSVAEEKPGTFTLIIGNSDWPFPVPIARRDNGWVWDALAGREEILNRRIGENELSAIQVCLAIGDAQREYALRDPDGNGVREYAQKFASDPGQRNGLYWPTVQGEEPSPLGELVFNASAEGYTRNKEGPTPYHGYCYRILLSQGPAAPNGAMDYVVNGKMILGFAVVAYPADYGNSGIMTFLMGPTADVFQKDLGEQTADVAGTMKVFDPGDGWTRVQ